MTPYSVRQKGWFLRNWIWFVPTGCLTLLVLVLAFIAAIVGIVESSLKSSDAYGLAVARAQSDPRVVEAIGQPIQPGFFISGSINVSGDSGDADITIPISGPKGKGKIYATATKIAGQWHFATLQVEAQAQPGRIDLLHSPR